MAKNNALLGPRDEKIHQEFYCAVSGGGCGGYIVVKMNIGINGVVRVICPKCGHEHGRIIQNGKIVENWSGQSHFLDRNRYTDQEIIPTMAAYRDKPRSQEYINGINDSNERNSPMFENKIIARLILRESVMDKNG